MDLPLNRKAARILTVWPRMEKISEAVRPGVFELPIRGEKFASL
jgi:hypothetical protein